MATPRRLKRQRGGALVESALTMLAFFFLIFGTLEYGMAVYAQNFCAYEAQDVARWASVNGATATTPATAASIQTRVRNHAAGLVASRVNVTTTWAAGNSVGSVVKVRLAYTPFPIFFLKSGSLTIASTAQMTIVR
jgi:Flp pilus assembly protein TadG